MTTTLTRLFLSLVTRLQSEERGATAIEYALLVGLIGVAVAGAAAALGTDITDAFSDVGGRLPGGD